MGKDRADKRFFINNVCYLEENQVFKRRLYTEREKAVFLKSYNRTIPISLSRLNSSALNSASAPKALNHSFLDVDKITEGGNSSNCSTYFEHS